MRDWTRYVRERLPLDGLAPERAERIVRELAAQLTDFYTDARARGLTDADADAYATRQIPDWARLAEDVVLAERPRARPRVDWLIDRAAESPRPTTAGRLRLTLAYVLRDAHHAVRQLGRTPAFSVVAILTIALGVGATSAVFSAVHGVLLRPLPYHDPDALVRVHEVVPEYGRFGVAPATFLDWRGQNRVFARLAAYVTLTDALTGGGEAERVPSALVSWDIFQLLGMRPALGATFVAAHDDVPDGAPVIVISHGLWQRRFGGDPDIVGRTVAVGGRPVTVLGVMPADFYFPYRETELWRPLGIDPADASRGAHYLAVIGRLRAGVTLDQADTEMKAIAARLARQYPEFSARESADAVALHEEVVGSSRRMLLTLFAAVSIVLLIACANVANLLLVRASVRQKDIAIRSALGAGRYRLLAQMLTESVVLAFAGGALGLLVAYAAVTPLPSLGSVGLPRVADIRVDTSVLLFTLAASLVTGLLFGLAPAWHGSAARLSGVLRDAGRWSSGGSGRWVRNGLLVVQVALSIVLVVSAALLVRSFERLTRVNPGFRPTDVLAFEVAVPPTRYPEDANRADFFQGLLERLSHESGVKVAGMIQTLPLRGSYSLSFQVTRRAPLAAAEQPTASHRVVSPGYFSAVGIPLIRGRLLTDADTSTSRLVALVDEAFVRRHFPNEDPIGQSLDIGNGVDGTYEIVGIVGDVRHHGLDASPAPTMYVPHAQDVFSSMWMVVRTDGDPAAFAARVRDVLRDIDAEVPASSLAPLSTIVGESVASERFVMLLLAVFAVVALTLSAIGVYGNIAYSVSQRTREIGVRLALGATRGDVLRLVVAGGLKLVAVGVGLGLASAVALAGFLEALLFEVAPLDPASYAVTIVLLLTVAVAACYLPARRAARLDPIVALQNE